MAVDIAKIQTIEILPLSISFARSTFFILVALSLASLPKPDLLLGDTLTELSFGGNFLPMKLESPSVLLVASGKAA